MEGDNLRHCNELRLIRMRVCWVELCPKKNICEELKNIISWKVKIIVLSKELV